MSPFHLCFGGYEAQFLGEDTALLIISVIINSLPRCAIEFLTAWLPLPTCVDIGRWDNRSDA